jgi:hypothetical protein
MNPQLPLDLPPSDDELLGRLNCSWNGCSNTVFRSQAIPATDGHVDARFCCIRCRDKWRDELPVRYQEW